MSLLVFSLSALRFFGSDPTNPFPTANRGFQVDSYALSPSLNLFIEYGDSTALTTGHSFITRCSGNADATRYLSTPTISSFIPSCESPHPSFDHEILSVDPMATLHLQPSHDYFLCFGHHHGQPFLLFGEKVAVLEFEEHCSFSTSLTRSLTIDPFLLLDPKTLGSDVSVSWQSVCGSIAHIVSSNQRLSKRIFVSHPGQISPNSGFEYWLSLCNISNLPSVTSATSFTPFSSSYWPFAEEEQDFDEDCTVQHVSLSSSSKNPRVLCLQDFFRHLGLNGSTTLPSSSSPFVFLSSLGLAFGAEQSFFEPQGREIFWILRAFQKQTFSSSLELLSVWRYALHDDERQVSLSFNSLRTECVEALLGTDLYRCEEFLRLSESTLSHRWNLVSFLTESISHISSRLCGEDFTSKDFLSFLLGWLFPYVTPETYSLLQEISGSEQMVSFSRCLPSVSDDQFGTVSLSEDSLLISSVTIHVLMFVSQDHLEEAQIILDLWNKLCPQCNLGTNFVIYSLADLDLSASPDHHQSWLKSPSALRRVLVVSENYMKRAVVENDVVVLLIGLSAIKGFAFPGESGVVPYIALNHRSVVRLPSPLLFGIRSLVDAGVRMWHDLIDVATIAGMSSAIGDLLAHLLPRSCGLNSRELAHEILKYVGDHREIVMIDHERNYFNQDQQRLGELMRSHSLKATGFHYGAHSVLRWAQHEASLSDINTLQVCPPSLRLPSPHNFHRRRMARSTRC
jgi:hypothetical protein